jgi:uncharacterized membrane protein
METAPAPSTPNRTIMGILAYMGILIIIPFILAKDDPFVKFHLKQGLVLVIIEIVLYVIRMNIFWYGGLWTLLNIVNLGVLVLAIMGIINVLQGKEKELPLVGNFARSFHFF